MKKSSFVLSAVILALGGFFAKAIGALYKIPLTNILGSAGMGLYYLVFPVYSLVITFCSSGINVALSTEVAKCRRNRNRYNEQKLLRVALVLSFCFSLLFTIIILLISKPLANFQGNINAYLGYVAIAPAIILSSIIATLRGYFQGVENMVPTTVSMIVEQIIKLSVGLIIAHKLCVYGIQYAVLGAIIGVTISEVVALIIICINFLTFKGQLFYNYRNKMYKGRRKYRQKFFLKSTQKYKLCFANKVKNRRYMTCEKKVRYTTKIALKKLLRVMFPATMSSIVLPIATMLDSFLIINILVNSGYSSLISTSLYGIWGGIVQSLISLPIILVSGISTSIVPSLSGVVAGTDRGRVDRRVAFFIKISFVLAIFMAIAIFVFAEDILRFLYGDGLSSNVINELYYATKMLKLSSISIIYYAFLQTFTAILQTIGKSHIPFWVLLCTLAFRIGLIVLMVSIPNINIFGAIIGHTLFLSLTILILSLFIRKYIDLSFYFGRQLIMPLVIGGVVLAFMIAIKTGLNLFLNYIVSMIISGVCGVVIYVIWVYFSKIFDDREKRNFLFKSKKLVKK